MSTQQGAKTKLDSGAAAPPFTLPADDGGSVSLQSFKGRKLVLYFYPKDDTSGCTKEAIDFNGLRKEFDKAGAAILGVSPDKTGEPCEVQGQAWPRYCAGLGRSQGDA